MTQPEWNILVHLKLDESPQYVGAVKASNQQDAEEKGTRLARGRGLTGLIEVLPSSNPDHDAILSDVCSW